MKTFLIGDTHFGHRNILKYESEHRPFETIEEHDRALIARWNSVVGKNDCVWHLGDVLFGKQSFELLPLLNGNKKLILGNHDNYPLVEYAKYFKKICAYYPLSGGVLSHIPIHPHQLYRYKFNIHGHLHSHVIDDPRYINVSVEQINLTPILLETVINRL